ncbi:MAG TPA: LuxR C-terminal-related transcriptional regulator [Verrucomicrobiae bacterium]|jgi:DNA-binding CsgD family transcriptional regulator|nr:LuxR C-terminal-related transcriptional regulator [Verrucomicrobiae bacterium]
MNSNALFKSVHEAGQSLITLLTGRENEILLSLSQGRANKEIADQMNISVPTVRTHLRHIYGKLAVRSRSEAIIRYFNETRPAGVPQLTVVTHKPAPKMSRTTEKYFFRIPASNSKPSEKMSHFH